MSSDSTKKTVVVALGVCLVCSVLVSSATVSLEPLQSVNKKLDKIENILMAGDISYSSANPEKIYEEKIKPVIIELKTGDILPEEKYNDVLNPEAFDIKKVKEDPAYSESIPGDKDIAGIKTKPKYMIVYEVVDKSNNVEKYIFPIFGKGLWSTLYGFIALDNNLKMVKGFTFYEHGETPGLGGEVDNPKWKALWKGKQAFDDNGNPIIQVIKGKVDPADANAGHEIDGLSGATLTTRGVNNLVNFWLSEEGYGVFLKKLRTEGHNEEI